jgi:hypothetical protein
MSRLENDVFQSQTDQPDDDPEENTENSLPACLGEVIDRKAVVHNDCLGHEEGIDHVVRLVEHHTQGGGGEEIENEQIRGCESWKHGDETESQ